jgi:ABC-type spermidine/putrescine transport system permease subunit I
MTAKDQGAGPGNGAAPPQTGFLAGTGGDRQPVGLLLVALPVALVATLIVWPIVVALITTLTPEGQGFSLSAYRFFFTDGYSLNNLWLTIWTTAVSILFLTVIAIPLAIYLRFTRGRAAALVQALALFPLFVPSIILAYAFVRVLGPNGYVDIVMNNIGLPRIASPYLTPWGPVIGFVWDNLPLSVLILVAGLSAIPQTAIEAARDVGAGRLQILLHILLPRLWPSLLVASAFIVLGLFSAFTFPYLLGPAAPEMMGPFMQRTFGDVGDPVQARTQAVITFAFCAVFGWLYVRSVARNRRLQAGG